MRLTRIVRWASGLLLAIGLLPGGVANARPGPAAPREPSTVLYDQSQHPSPSNSWATTSKFETVNAPFDSQAADDFVVTKAFWQISTITVYGIYDGPGNAVVDSILVQIYFDTGTSPATPGSQPLRSETILSSHITGLTTGLFVFNLSSTLRVGPGHYWLSVQANKGVSDGRQWGWLESTVRVNSESVWQNPNGGQATSCTTWQPRVSVCHEPATNSQGSDLVFKLEGSSTPAQNQIFLPVVRRQ